MFVYFCLKWNFSNSITGHTSLMSTWTVDSFSGDSSILSHSISITIHFMDNFYKQQKFTYWQGMTVCYASNLSSKFHFCLHEASCGLNSSPPKTMLSTNHEKYNKISLVRPLLIRKFGYYEWSHQTYIYFCGSECPLIRTKFDMHCLIWTPRRPTCCPYHAKEQGTRYLSHKCDWYCHGNRENLQVAHMQ